MVSFCRIFLPCFLSIIISVEASLIDPKIIGGYEARTGQFPYQVSLKMNGQHICGGTIVNNRHVVTAGHCVQSEKNILVSARKLKVDVGTTSRKGVGGISYPIEKITVPDGYSTTPIITSDIAVLRIKGNFSFNQFVQPLAIAQEVYTSNANCTISGWGRTQAGSNKLPEILNYAVVNIIDIMTCQSWIGSNVARDMICAGYSMGGIDSCQGDSGGPLVCNNTLTGVVSHGFGCALPGRPGIYTDVQVHNKWTSEILLKGSCAATVPFVAMVFTIIIFYLV